MVTEVDRESEKIITGLIRGKFPGHLIYSEETKISLTPDEIKNNCLWVIDPIDGTTNFVHGIPLLCIALTFYAQGLPEAAVIYDPFHLELFSALKGRGAFLNEHPIQVSESAELSKALVATGFPYIRRRGNDNTDHIFNLAPRVRDFRRSGTGLLDMAYVACGRLDAYFEHELEPWDTTAGAFLVKEAGGTVTDYEGGEFTFFTRALCATNGKIHRELLSVLSSGTSGFKKIC